LKERILLNKLKKRNEKAFQQFYAKYAPQYKYIVFRYVRDEKLAEDLVQDGFMRILDKVSQYNGSGTFEAWSRKIFVNLALEYLRKNKKMVFGEDSFIESIENAENNENEAFAYEMDMESISEDMVNMDIVHAANFSDEDLEDAIEQLPEHYKIVFNLYVIDGYKHKEISNMLDINEKTSKSRLSKARKITQMFLYRKALEKVRKEQSNAR